MTLDLLKNLKEDNKVEQKDLLEATIPIMYQYLHQRNRPKVIARRSKGLILKDRTKKTV
jgi:hypothetical protein